jgi:predicted  nucleic acid-binding Zn-ribbon protein
MWVHRFSLESPMILKRLFRFFLGAMTVTALALAPACKSSGEDKEIKDLSQKAAELDKLSQQASASSFEQTRKLKEAGVNDVRPNAATLQLTEEQKNALEERIKAEKNSSYQALLQEVLDKDKELKTLNEKITRLRAVLPRPDVAKANDSHYGLAMRFLRRKGVPEEKAKALISRVLIMDKLAPGFEVYHFYNNGVYGSWVSQGRAAVTPTQLQAEEKAKIEGERDAANDKSAKLAEEVADLNAQKAAITADIDALRTEKTNMIKELEGLAATNESQKAKLSSLHYVVGSRKALEKDGVIVVPVFAKDRAGANWSDGVFTKSLDLRSKDTITLTAADAGLQKIAKVSVVPGSLEKDKHYTLTLSDDRTTATVKILVKDRFLNEKVAFALAE